MDILPTFVFINQCVVTLVCWYVTDVLQNYKHPPIFVHVVSCNASGKITSTGEIISSFCCIR